MTSPGKRKRSPTAPETMDGHSNKYAILSPPSPDGENGENGDAAGAGAGAAASEDKGEEWQKVPRTGKKKKKRNYPAITIGRVVSINGKIKISSLQGLVLYLFADGVAPQWCAVQHKAEVRKVVVLLAGGLEQRMFDGDVERRGPDEWLPVQLEKDRMDEDVQGLEEVFDRMWPVLTPGDPRSNRIESPVLSMLTVPLTKGQEKKVAEGGGKWIDRKTDITKLLMSKEDMWENEYVLHPACVLEEDKAALEQKRKDSGAWEGWVDTKVASWDEGEVPNSEFEKGSMTRGRQVYALDCEMCRTEDGDLDLARISIVNWDGETILDELCVPDKKIIDYLTPYSGITKEILEPVTTTLRDIQAKLLELITPRTILVGHSLNADLNALKLTHPFIVDTTLVFPHARGPPLKNSLKYITQKHLNREIQRGDGSHGHDSIEDAKACIELVKLKCEKGLAYASAEPQGESIYKRLGRSKRVGTAAGQTRTGAVVDTGYPNKWCPEADVKTACLDDDDVVKSVLDAVTGPAEAVTVPGGGVDFVWGRLRDLENARGWAKDCPAGPEEEVSQATRKTIERIKTVHEGLPPCTLLVVYSGMGDPREWRELIEQHKQFKAEYRIKKWDELSVKWTDIEDQKMKAALSKMRNGLGFLTVK